MSLGPQDERTLNLRTTRATGHNATQGKQTGTSSKFLISLITQSWTNYNPTLSHNSQRPDRSNQFEIDCGTAECLACPLLEFTASSPRVIG